MQDIKISEKPRWIAEQENQEEARKQKDIEARISMRQEESDE